MNVNILFFNDFEALDAFGPIEILSKVEECKLNSYSLDGGIIASTQGTSVLTEKLETAPKDGILVIPGGVGVRALFSDSQFLMKLKEAVEQSCYCLTVCTGSGLLARTGLLDGKKATSNKRVFDWVASSNLNVNWIKSARWVVDGKYYTSSGVSAGMDMTLGFIKDRFGDDKANSIARLIEYIWNSDSSLDLFAR